MTKRVCLGKIIDAHGIKGLVKIMPFGDDPALIETLGPASTSDDETAQTRSLVITLKNAAGKYILAAVEGITDRTQAETLKGTELFYDRALLPQPDEGEIYYDDLIGLNVIEGAQPIGKVKSVQNFGASDLLEIKPTAGASFYLPYTNDYVGEINLDDQTIEIFNSEDFQAS